MKTITKEELQGGCKAQSKDHIFTSSILWILKQIREINTNLIVMMRTLMLEFAHSIDWWEVRYVMKLVHLWTLG